MKLKGEIIAEETEIEILSCIFSEKLLRETYYLLPVSLQ